MTKPITIIGVTASGKTSLAVKLAHETRGEIISADSRQIYRRMDLGTGKDISEYTYDGTLIPYHLIDICEPGYKYNLYQYKRDFTTALNDIKTRGKLPVICGGTGLYVETVLKGYAMPEVPENRELRDSLADKTLDELTTILTQYKTLHNTTDVDSCKRAIRAIEIAEYYKTLPQPELEDKPLDTLLVAIDIDRETRRANITKRLHERLDQGMVAEVEALLNEGIAPDDLIYYGLEYKYLTEYVIGKTTYDEMVSGLEIAIHQFAKRQMTWFRGMERRGFKINWIDYNLSTSDKVSKILELYKSC
ncbi:MAG: tRNA (adenosine(37)-N6)-dimethylallyltransferase MiaA [Muribaculaceae bacterium]|nr:tRNA (adenosine(37)-N6)-dimethylallyltransferase MiaA [Muribaculaceae bacterium]